MVEYKNKILIVDSNKSSMDMLQSLLSQNYQVIKASSPFEALDFLGNNLIDVVISDFDLPEMNGIEFLEKCYKLNHLNTRLLLTENDNFDVLLNAINSGNIYNYIKKPFTQEELLAAVDSAINDNEDRKENNILIYDLKKLLRGTIDSIVSALDAKDSFTLGRSHRVKILTLKMAECYDLSLKERGEIELAGLLHDIGMIGVPESILKKVGPLSEEEFECVKNHVNLSVKIIGDIKQLQGVAKIIKSHHERFNGRGYPEGIKGEEIPLGSKMISIADAYDSMVSKRAYRESLTNEEAMKLIEEQRGHQFDPQIIDSFKNVIDDALIEIKECESRKEQK